MGVHMTNGSQVHETNGMIACVHCWVVLCGVVFSAGCGEIQDEPVGAEGNNAADAALDFDAGDLLRGETARHVFSFTNNATETLTLDPDKDIRKTCGCTRPEIEKLTLQPGETTDVTLLVDTKSKTGSFSESSALVWRDAKGAEHPTKYRLSGRVVSPLVFSPNAVLLETKDLVEGKEFEIRVTSELDIDWSSMRIMGLTDSLSYKYEETSTGGVIRFQVDKFKQTTPVLAEVVCTVAPVYATFDSAPDAAASRRYAGTIPIYMEPAATLRLAADSLQLKAGDAATDFTGSLMILGSADLVPTGDDFITLAGSTRTVEHQIVPISGSLFRVDLSISSSHLSDATQERQLIVRLDGNRELPVRIHLPRS